MTKPTDTSEKTGAQTPAPTEPESQPSFGRRFLRGLRDWVVTFAIVIAILAPVRSVIADWNDVPTGSMEPTILPGDRIVVNKLAYGLRVPFTSRWITRWDAPEPGEIVILYSPANGDRLVKRIIGLPGDEIAMINNQLSINGAPLSLAPLNQREVDDLDDWVHLVSGRRWVTERIGAREHLVQLTPNGGARSSFAPIVVPEGQYFVMGDNRNESGDSRAFGFVKQSKIHGRSSAVAFSLDPARWPAPRLGRLLKGIQ